jgi:hypothetical protein
MTLSTRLPLWAALLILSASCGIPPRTSRALDQQAKQFLAPPPRTAGIYICEYLRFPDRNPVETTLDGRPVGMLTSASYFYVEVPAGVHVLRGADWPFTATIVFNAEGGSLYYFRPEFIGLHAVWLPLEPEAGHDAVEAYRRRQTPDFQTDLSSSPAVAGLTGLTAD